MNLLEQIIEATVEGDEERCVSLAQQVLDQGLDPFEAIQGGFTKGIQSLRASRIHHCYERQGEWRIKRVRLRRDAR